jgi:PAS domain S-box-containing protein
LKAQSRQDKLFEVAKVLIMANEDVQKTLAELSRDLQESKARLEEAQRVAHVGHWEWDLETDVVVWSDETYRIFGLSPQERPMDLATVRAMVHPEDREFLYRGVDQDLLAGVRPEAEFRIVRPNGEVRTVQSLTSRRWSSMPGDARRDASGQPYKLFGTVQDITERKRTEEALQEISRNLLESKARLEEAQRVAHVGHYYWNLVTNRVTWSDELYRIYALSPQEGPIDMAMIRDMIHPEDREFVFRAAEEALHSEVRPDAEHRLVRPNGEVRTVHGLGTVKRDASGRPYEMFGTVQDITDRKRAEEALQRTQLDLREVTRELQRQQAYLTEAQSLTHIGSWACNLVTREIFHSSDENARLYGFDPGEGAIPFDRFYNTILTEDELALRPKLEKAIRAGADYDAEFRIRRTDGAIRFLRGIGHHNPSQEIGEYVGITMDITERKRAEEEREKLRQLEADLAHINRVSMMGEMAASLAHEIKQPITAAVMNAQACLRLLERNEPNIVKAHEAAFGMAGCATRAAEIIDRVRSLFGNNAPQHEAVDVNEVIRDIVVLLQNEARRHSVVVHTQLAEDLPTVMGDHVQLQQVLMNLMLNGIESMRDAPGELRITSGQVDERGVLISVSDTGVGLPAEKLDQIFNAFFTTKPQGTGMGLAISRSIIESHGGHLWAEANNGRGAIFRFTLPQQTAERA